MKHFTSAIIAASGNSTRMGLSVSKQLLSLCGRPTIEHTLSAFENCDVIDEIVVVCREIDMQSIKDIATKFTKVKAVVSGGETRDESVKNGVYACSENARFFAIHDGARPLIKNEDIKKVVKRAYECNAATLGTAVTDTIKVVDSENVITSTPDRAVLRAVQTPQVFEKELYLKAIDNALLKGLSVTDDCSMVEALGERVEIVTGSAENIKLTTKPDIIFAEAILKAREHNS
ncbi:MAG: 2-C-methyl-D-erythritol 4-phosphate cytidylyltransferase [Ruminococcus sp.]|nr:2-C-methyl-D-erythritol 4-phosphate cytidylyltransferase [Ruminococcus sp.]